MCKNGHWSIKFNDLQLSPSSSLQSLTILYSTSILSLQSRLSLFSTLVLTWFVTIAMKNGLFLLPSPLEIKTFLHYVLCKQKGLSFCHVDGSMRMFSNMRMQAKIPDININDYWLRLSIEMAPMLVQAKWQLELTLNMQLDCKSKGLKNLINGKALLCTFMTAITALIWCDKTEKNSYSMGNKHLSCMKLNPL